MPRRLTGFDSRLLFVITMCAGKKFGNATSKKGGCGPGQASEGIMVGNDAHKLEIV